MGHVTHGAADGHRRGHTRIHRQGDTRVKRGRRPQPGARRPSFRAAPRHYVILSIDADRDERSAIDQVSGLHIEIDDKIRSGYGLVAGIDMMAGNLRIDMGPDAGAVAGMPRRIMVMGVEGRLVEGVVTELAARTTAPRIAG